jgi:uncharacterized membrane protein (DUF485 family)
MTTPPSATGGTGGTVWMFPHEEEREMPQSVDWEAVERSPEFRDLVARRRRFVLPATIFFLAWYLGFILLAGYAEDFMGSSIYEGFTVGYLLALSQFVMTWGLAAWYLRRADREFDPLEREVVELVERGQLTDVVDDEQRFTRQPTTTPEATS